MHSDAASFYRKIQSDDFPNITRIACLQHIKRKFIDCMDAEPEARAMVKLINKLYHEEHKHKIGEKGWTVKDIFKRGDTALDNNLVERMNHLNLFDYLVDILDRTATWQPNTPLEKYRNLLPDRWQPSTED